MFTHKPTIKTHTHTKYTVYRNTCVRMYVRVCVRMYLVEVEDQVELTDVAEELIQDLHKVVDGLQVAEVVVLQVQTEAEVQPSVPSVDNLEVTELKGQGGGSAELYIPRAVGACMWRRVA